MSEQPKAAVLAFLPKGFLNKKINEPFIQRVMEVVLEHDNWSQGNADNFEPDYFCDGVPFEFTIASNRRSKENYIQKFRSGSYTTEDAEKDVIQYIQESIRNKLEKQYSVSNVHLCVLCLMNLSNWVFDECGSRTQLLFDDVRSSFFSQIKAQCIVTNKFRNVFIIFPDMYAKWWVWDVLTNNKASIQLSPQEILSGKYPFWINNGIYKELLKSSSAK